MALFESVCTLSESVSLLSRRRDMEATAALAGRRVPVAAGFVGRTA